MKNRHLWCLFFYGEPAQNNLQIDFIFLFWYTNKKISCSSVHVRLGGIHMAENKQYISKVQENGAVLISEDVISAIVAQAMKDVEGVIALSQKSGVEIVDIISKKNWGKSIKVDITDDNKVSITCGILIGYGQSVVDVAKSVQTTVASAVESMAGVKVEAVNVNVCGIIRQ